MPVSRAVLVGAFTAFCLALALGYYIFLRVDYAVLYSGLKPADASAIVKELDAKGIAHRLRDDGTTILVPTDQADTVRLAVAGSDIPMKGSVGFELFNKSDMGLTDFAQKINYQRALQGEIARTIMMMDGIETARVHLAIPERSLFRGSRSAPKAAIEVIAKLGRPLTTDRVAGIQQLVASAVPELALSDVSILDGDGRLISQAVPPVAIPVAPELAEQAAAQQYFSARAKNALAVAMPGVEIGVRVLILQKGASDSVAVSRPEPGRDFRLRVTVLSPEPMNADDEGIARVAITRALALDDKRGDGLTFEVGPASTSPPVIAPISPGPLPSFAPAALPSVATTPYPTMSSLIEMLGVLAVAALAVFAIAWSRRLPLSPQDRDAFVARIRAGLASASADASHV